jgi:purine nucleoside permease
MSKITTHYDEKTAKTEAEMRAAPEKQHALQESVPKDRYIARKTALLIVLTVLICAAVLLSCSPGSKKTALKVIIIPKFEVGEMAGDFPGEAQLFYEEYCAGCEEAEIPNMPPTGHFYVNKDNGVGMLVTGSGKTAAALSLMAVLSSEAYDYSNAYIVSVGCGGGSAEYCTLGDVILVTSVCDYDLGHHVDAHERKSDDSRVMWFPDKSYEDYEFKYLNKDLCEKAYQLIREVPLRTTEQSKEEIKDNFPAREESDLLPAVRKGTALSGDNYWKGEYGHVTANFISEYYGCPDPYMVTEMEEVAIANTADCFGMLDRVISLRVIVNMDVFLNGATPESTWGEYKSYNEKVEEKNDETLDIFEPAMHNLFNTGSMIIDALLDDKLQ